MKTSIRAVFGCLVLFYSHFGLNARAQQLTKLLELGGPNQAQTGLVQGSNTTLFAWDRGSDSDRKGRIASLGKAGSAVTPLHAFTGTAADGDTPFCLIYGSDGMLYGVTVDAQAKTRGRAFALSPDGNNYRTLRRWDSATNEHGSPFGLIEGSDKALYGVAQPGGTLGSDTIWKLNKDGSGYQVLHDFEAGFDAPDTTFGPSLAGNLIEGTDGKLYGVGAGSSTGLGMIYRLNLDGTGFETIHEFLGSGLGSGPFGRLLRARDGFLYGVGNNGGTGNRPVIYRLQPDGTAFQVLLTASIASFDSDNQLVESGNGYLYGTSANGGAFVGGLLYRVRLDGSGFEMLHEFNLVAQPALGIQPTAPLFAGDGNLYFTTLQQTSFVGIGEWRPFLLGFGPVPLPPANTSPLMITSTFASVGTNRLFSLSFHGTPGHQYDIQSADQLPPAWLSAQKVTADSAGNVQYQNDVSVGPTSRFFRVVE